jgi:hypothetical protein
MFALVLAIAFVLALSARLVTDIRHDRPVNPPRSHWHEVDPTTACHSRQLV